VEAQRVEQSKFQRDHPDGIRNTEPLQSAVAGYQAGSIPAPITSPWRYGSAQQGTGESDPSYGGTTFSQAFPFAGQQPLVSHAQSTQGYNVPYGSYTTSNISPEPLGGSQQIPGSQGSGQLNPYPYASGDLPAGIGRLSITEKGQEGDHFKQVGQEQRQSQYRGNNPIREMGS
jgi:hypothetical protein